MGNVAQTRAIGRDRRRLADRGVVRFEVQAREADRELIRALARRLAEDGPEAREARSAVLRIVGGEPPKSGGILQALRR